MHLTLKFLGDIEEDRADTVAKALQRASESTASFTLTARDIDFKGQRILWVGFEPSTELVKLKDDIEAELKRVGIEQDRRPYAPHLTLMRIRKKERFLEIKKRLDTLGRSLEISFIAGGVELLKSELTALGAKHSTIKKVIFHNPREMDDI